MNKNGRNAGVKQVDSPCIRNCCLDDDDICMGCFRHVNEITAWQAMSAHDRGEVLERCHTRKRQYQIKFKSIN